MEKFWGGYRGGVGKSGMLEHMQKRQYLWNALR